jgi:hypothetical protein
MNFKHPRAPDTNAKNSQFGSCGKSTESSTSDATKGDLPEKVVDKPQILSGPTALKLDHATPLQVSVGNYEEK